MHETIKTQGIKYTGSKLKLLPYILTIVNNLGVKTVFDGFSGTTRVSQALALSDYKVISNDISEWSKVFATAYLLNDKSIEYYKKLIEHLNNITPYEGWFSENYGASNTSQDKKPFQLHNTMKLDAIRDEIDKLNLDYIDKCVCLTSLILALDKVDNTVGHYAAYLNKWSPRSYDNMLLHIPNLIKSNHKHLVLSDDILNIADKYTADLIYLDPPYGSNNEKMPPSRVRYAAYYHIWKTVILNDEPKLFGKVGRREDSSDKVNNSVFEEFRKDSNNNYIAIKAIEDLIIKCSSQYLLLSYSSGGRATFNQLYDTLSSNGQVISVNKIDYKKNVMAQMSWTKDWVSKEDKLYEYLFLLKKF